jgi:hypothetical protein
MKDLIIFAFCACRHVNMVNILLALYRGSMLSLPHPSSFHCGGGRRRGIMTMCAAPRKQRRRGVAAPPSQHHAHPAAAAYRYLLPRAGGEGVIDAP